MPPYGIQGMVSRDDDRTWNGEKRLLLVGDSGTYECDYPRSVQRENGTIALESTGRRCTTGPKICLEETTVCWGWLLLSTYAAY